jgi:tryptophan synthase alpha subunit
LIRKTLSYTKDRIPLAAGFGISTPGHVKTIAAAGADGAIVGSAFVRVIEDNHGNLRKTVMTLQRMSRDLKMATRRGRSRLDKQIPRIK